VLLLCGGAFLTSKVPNMRLFYIMAATVSPFCGFLLMSLLPQSAEYQWPRWGSYFMTLTFTTAFYMSWTLLPSNIAGRTKRTLVSTAVFVGYCVGNVVGSQIFQAWDKPRYVHGTVGCAICIGCQFLNAALWRTTLAMRNKKRAKHIQELGISEEERLARGKELGEQDYTDKENPYVSP
jgi:ACS family allantoate permease-like MFS transporter